MDAFEEVTEYVRALVSSWLIQHGTEIAKILSEVERPLLPKLSRITVTESGVTFPDPECQTLWRELQFGSPRMPSYQVERWVTSQLDLYLTNRYLDEVQ